MAYEKQEWHPVTGLGKLVASGEIKSIDQVLESGRPIKEPEIVDAFLPDLEDEVLDIAMTQRMTDSGRRVQFRAVVIVGNRNGYIGFNDQRRERWQPDSLVGWASETGAGLSREGRFVLLGGSGSRHERLLRYGGAAAKLHTGCS